MLKVKSYSPLAIKHDAKAPHQAVILGTDVDDGSTILPLAATPATVQIDTVFVTGADPLHLDARVARVALTATPAAGPPAGSNAQPMRIADVPGTNDAAWHSAVWSSARVATTVLDKDLGDVAFTITGGDATDGAAVSALVAAGLIAALTGAPVDTAVTVAGALNPDGTLAPVTAMPERLLAAIQSGKARIGYPVGMRHARSARSGKLVDLQALAKQHGAQAIAVANVHDTYRLLTGQPLPATVPVTEQEMELEPTTIATLEAKYAQWQSRLATEWATILQLESAGRMPQVLAYLRDHAKSYAEAAEALHGQQRHGAAYARMFAAALYASTVTQAYDVLSRVRTGKVADAVALLVKHESIAQQTTAIFSTIAEPPRTTIGGHLQALAAYRAALRGWVFETFASEAVARAKTHVQSLIGKSAAELGADQTAEGVVNVVLPALLYASKTLAESTLAAEQLELQGASDLAYTPSLSELERVTGSLRAAGAAGMSFVDALLVEPFAASAQLELEEARRRVAVFEPDYLVGHMTAHFASADGLPRQLRDTWTEASPSWHLLSLASGELAHVAAAELVTKYAALRAQIARDGSGRIESVADDKAFANMLAGAERMARASARAARIATGSIPVQARLAYQNAQVDRDGTLGEQMDALAQYWAASAYSQAAVMLARNQQR